MLSAALEYINNGNSPLQGPPPAQAPSKAGKSCLARPSICMLLGISLAQPHCYKLKPYQSAQGRALPWQLFPVATADRCAY